MQVNTANYFDTIEKVGVANLSSDFKEMHEYVQRIYSPSKGWSNYEKNKAIHDVLSDYFNALSATIDDLPKTSKKSSGENKKERTAKPKEKSSSPTANSLFKEGETVYFKKSGIKCTVDAVLIPLSQINEDVFIYRLIDEKRKYYETVAENEITDEVPEESIEAASSNKLQLQTKGNSKAKSTTFNKKQKKQAKAPGGKTPPPKKEKSNGEAVEMVSPELMFIREWISMNGKTKPINKVASFLSRMQKAIIEKRIRKTSAHAKDLTEVQKEAIKLHTAMEKSRSTQVEIEIAPARLANLMRIAGLQHLMPTVQLIKAYLKLMGKPIEREKAINLHKRIKNAADKNVFTTKDPYITQIQQITASLESFADSKKKFSVLEIHPAQLNGLQGVLDGCGCNSLNGFDDESAEVLTEDEIDEDDTPKTMSAEEAANREYTLLNFDDPRFSFLGNPASRFAMMVHGLPGAGKTTFLLLFAEFLALNYGRVLYVTPEEYDSPTLTMILNRLNISVPGNLTFAEYITDEDPANYDFIFIDSVNDHDMTYEEFRALRKKYKTKSFIAVFQTTKDGDLRGVQKWKHKADLACAIEDGKIHVIKSRFGSFGNVGDVPGYISPRL